MLENRFRFLLDRAISLLGKYAQNLFLMLRSKCFNRNHKFHSRITIDRYKLVMLKFDDISVLTGDHTCDTLQFSRLIRKQYGYGEDTAPCNQSMLYDR